jgi:hypothetical protein
MRIELGDEDLFTAATAPKLIWRSRLDYYARVLASLDARLTYTPDDLMTHSVQISKEKNLVTTYFINAIGMIENDTFDDRFRQRLRVAAHNLKDKGIDLQGVFALVVLNHVYDQCEACPMPTILAAHATEMAGAYFRDFHRPEWLELSELFSDKWEPFGMPMGKPLSRSKLRRRSS